MSVLPHLKHLLNILFSIYLVLPMYHTVSLCIRNYLLEIGSCIEGVSISINRFWSRCCRRGVGLIISRLIFCTGFLVRLRDGGCLCRGRLRLRIFLSPLLCRVLGRFGSIGGCSLTKDKLQLLLLNLQSIQLYWLWIYCSSSLYMPFELWLSWNPWNTTMNFYIW